MKKTRLMRAVCAWVIAFPIITVASSTAEAIVNNAVKYANQDTHVHSMTTGAGQVKRNGNDSLATDLQGTVVGVSCGLIGVFLLRIANKR